MSIKWDGEGLPPVGCDCEIYDCETWNPVIIKYIGEKYVTTHRLDLDSEIVYCVAQRPEKFRPICTEAERRRNEIVQIMCNILGNGIHCDENSGYGKAWFKTYDAIAAGKIPGIRLTDDAGS
ncbi:hypothetical protein LU631_02470 [Erwinia tracheiphila]|uniref:Uncharacterized protein n=1 Tax=Erwinia tracheiphila TaxID=65700 RepID=A0A0M2KDG1_9GAMM|nr:hypothetical protein [Erwinia tracheiphila]KKF36969.1 hypothetical protein SY86_18535 [Erwinia tracheiphila]UIA88315.1 hypothetical protein LU631_02470 [Erwinia tracheiphila]UIA96264.1 hypothetical protein LU633_23690 [Erwinia tracheiphila]